MIADSALKVLAVQYHTTELNVRREYLQHLFLSYFYRQPQANKVYFKGGTALRILYQSPRFSEDLDFSASLKNIKQIEHMILETLLSIEREGIKAQIEEAKITSGGYLASITFQMENYNISIRIEISFRDMELKGEIQTAVSDYLPPYTATVLKQEQLINGKIRALLSRQKPRDFYDLYFILRANLLLPQNKTILSKILNMANSSDIHFEKELKLFLPKSHWKILKNFPLLLKNEIKKNSL